MESNTRPEEAEIEKSMICAMLSGKKEIQEKVAVSIKPEWFSDKIRREIFLREKKLFFLFKDVDLVMLRNETRDIISGSKELIESLVDKHGEIFYPASQTDYYIEAMIEQYKKRKLKSAMTMAFKDIANESFNVASGKLIREILETKATASKNNITKMPKDFIEVIRQNKHDKLIKTGFKELDKHFYGFRPGQYVAIVGRPSCGKTAFTLNLLKNICFLEKKGVAFLSLETSEKTIMTRLVATEAGIQQEKLLKGSLHISEEWPVIEAVKRIADAPFYVSDMDSYDIDDVMNTIRQLKHYDPSVIMFAVDHMRLITSKKDTGGSRQKELADISRQIKLLCETEEIVIVPLVHLSRAVENDKRTIPQMSDIKDCGNIEEDADIILAFHNEEKEDERQIRILKAKEGQRNISIPFGWEPETQRFT